MHSTASCDVYLSVVCILGELIGLAIQFTDQNIAQNVHNLSIYWWRSPMYHDFAHHKIATNLLIVGQTLSFKKTQCEYNGVME